MTDTTKTSDSEGRLRSTYVTNYWPKPIPVRAFDWSAISADYAGGGPVGYGATEAEAISDLRDQGVTP